MKDNVRELMKARAVIEHFERLSLRAVVGSGITAYHLLASATGITVGQAVSQVIAARRTVEGGR